MNSTDKSLRVLHIVSSLLAGGMETFVVDLCAAQRRKGGESSVLALKHGPLISRAHDSGVPFRIIEEGLMATRVARVLLFVARMRPEIIHAHNPTALHYAAASKLVSGARIVLTDHAQTRGIVRRPTKLEWKMTSAVAAVSAHTARQTHLLGFSGNPLVVPNGIELRSLRGTREELRSALGLVDRTVGIHVGAFVPVKAQEVLMRAVARLQGRVPRLTLLLVGDGPLRARVEELTRTLGLSKETVRFLGYRSDVVELMAASEFFVLPSQMEGFPISTLEAMSQGLPSVLTPVGGTPEQCTDGVHALFVPVNDDVALAKAMGRLALEPDLRKRLGDAAFAKVESAFTIERSAEHYADIYRHAIDASP